MLKIRNSWNILKPPTNQKEVSCSPLTNQFLLVRSDRIEPHVLRRFVVAICCHGRHGHATWKLSKLGDAKEPIGTERQSSTCHPESQKHCQHIPYVYSFCEHFGRRISDICEKMYNIITNCRRSSSKCRFPEIGVPPVIIHFNRIPYKQSFFGYPHLWKPQMCFQSKEWFVLDHRLHLYKSRAAQ